MNDNIEFVFDIEGNEHIVIDRGNGNFTSMPKEVWEEQQRAIQLGGTL